MLRKFTLALSAAVALAGSAQAATLGNVSFESGLDDWTAWKLFGSGTVGAVGSTAVNGVTVDPQSGLKMAELSSTGLNTVNLFQTAADPLGAGYTLWYRMVTADRGGGFLNLLSDTFLLSWRDGSSNWHSIDILTSKNLGGSDTGWQSFLLPSNTTGLSFNYLGDPDNRRSWAFVDVSPVPEPGEWAMILAGFGLIGFMAKRRRRGGAY